MGLRQTELSNPCAEARDNSCPAHPAVGRSQTTRTHTTTPPMPSPASAPNPSSTSAPGPSHTETPSQTLTRGEIVSIILGVLALVPGVLFIYEYIRNRLYPGTAQSLTTGAPQIPGAPQNPTTSTPQSPITNTPSLNPRLIVSSAWLIALRRSMIKTFA